MSGIIPYFVLAAVVLIFFAVCYAVFNKNDKADTFNEAVKIESEFMETHVPSVSDEEQRVSEEERRHTRGENTFFAEVTDDNHIINDTSIRDKAAEPIEGIQGDTHEHPEQDGDHVGMEQEDTIALGESVEVMSDDRETALDATQMMGENTLVFKEGIQRPSTLDETKLFDADTINEHLERQVKKDSAAPFPEEQTSDEDEHIATAVDPFVHAFGVIHGNTKYYVTQITREALDALGITESSEVIILLENIVIQEALMAMQKAYAATPTAWMKTAALGAFLDVVQSPKSSTPYLVAFDALRVLPHMTLGHFQVMALTLLLQYSRNSNNYGLVHFQHYVQKYIEPFISNLPYDPSFYRQLEYLRCTMQEQEPITMAQLLSNSYPFVFNYRGFTKEELYHATAGAGVDPRYVVRSLNSDLYKLAMVDESMAPRFFRQTRISNCMVQRDLVALMKSKPAAFQGREARKIMDSISPVLLDLADLYDHTPMSSISLTLLGLYLGRAHVKATIGEEFDLSRWF